MKRPLAALGAALLLGATAHPQPTLPPGFVYLSSVAPNVIQDIRYYGYHNFVGRPIRGYDAPECILTKQAANALAAVQNELEENGMTLRVYDCYRPQRASDEFIAWSKDPTDQRMKAEFYPRVAKADLFKLGYIHARSGHSRGSTVDVTIERLPLRTLPPYHPGDPPRACIAPYAQRFHDGTLDMGVPYDCMDVLAQKDADVGAVADSHRQLLASVMEKHGFKSYAAEWWHFSYRWEPFPKTYFDFPIRPSTR